MGNRILIVDDQRDISRLLRSALETIEQGLDVSEAPSGEEALLEAGRVPVDLLVVDYRLPGMSGVELIEKMRARYPEMKFIVISGMTESKAQEEIEKSGAYAFFVKPIPMSDFLGAVESCMGLARTVLQETKEQKPDEKKTLVDLLVGLRKELSAESVFLLNGLGHVEAEAGELLDADKRVALISSLMGMHNAAQKAAGLLGKNKLHLHVFDGDETDLVFIPVGVSHVLWVSGRGLGDLGAISTTLDALNASKAKVLEILEQIEVEEAPEKEPAAPGGTPAYMESVTIPIEFDELLKKSADVKVDANAFWDQAIEQGPQYTEPDKLTYEQAAQLGLAPKNNEEKK
jgi:CheY-like chemotaxis protein